MLMQVDPRRLLTFSAVARQRSFSRAADDLSLTQSAVSQQVAALERQIGARLLRRGRGGVELTAVGEHLLAHATALAERVELARMQLEEIVSKDQLELRVGAFPSAMATIVPRAVARLSERHGTLDARLTEGRAEELVAGVRAGALHVALAFQDAGAPRREHEGTRRRDLLEEPMVLLLPPDHRLAGRRSLRIADLAGERWTAPSRSGLVARACRAAGFEPHITILTSDPLAIAELVETGLAVTMTSRLLARRMPGVRTVAIEGTPPHRVLYALVPDHGARPLDNELLSELELAAAGSPRR
jgi:DNA-binding transcriptional LysR family regulator